MEKMKICQNHSFFNWKMICFGRSSILVRIMCYMTLCFDHPPLLGDIYFLMGRKREAIYMWRQAKDLAKPEDNISDTIQTKLDKYNAG